MSFPDHSTPHLAKRESANSRAPFREWTLLAALQALVRARRVLAVASLLFAWLASRDAAKGPRTKGKRWEKRRRLARRHSMPSRVKASLQCNSRPNARLMDKSGRWRAKPNSDDRYCNAKPFIDAPRYEPPRNQSPPTCPRKKARAEHGELNRRQACQQVAITWLFHLAIID